MADNKENRIPNVEHRSLYFSNYKHLSFFIEL